VKEARLALAALALGLAPLASAAPARAFCGFYVAGADSTLHNEATTVVLMREGHRTVLSMQNDYRGPVEDFALVVPVPVVLQRDDVRTLDREIFTRLERMTGPRLVEYWEQDPCEAGWDDFGGLGLRGTGRGGGGTGEGTLGLGGLVRVEAQFAVGEYDIVVLGADDSSALDAWLREHQYRIPDGAAEALRPYVESGMKFFVARVDVDRVRFESGRAVLSPLRVHYDTEQLSLPVRLGLLSSSGTQDLVVQILARDQRYEVANYPNVFIPTNLDVSDDVRERFGDFYGALFDRTIERNPGAVVTEYAWQATTCDPCPPGTTIDAQTLTTLGGDVLYADGVAPVGWGGSGTIGLGNLGAGPGYHGGPTTVRLERPAVTGAMDADVVRRVTQRHLNELRFCYEQGLARQPALEGTAEATWTLEPSGRAVEVQLARVEGDIDAAVLACMQSAWSRWTFPVPEGQPRITQRVRLASSGSAAASAVPASPSASEFVVTRLHYRYGRDGLGEDLVFRAAPPVIGGRELRNEAGALEEGARPADSNNFQGRYAIRHPWEGEIACESPVRGRWGGPPEASAALGRTTAPAVAPAHGGRGDIALEPVVLTPVASLGLPGRDAAADAPTAGAPSTPAPPPAPMAEAPPASAAPAAEPDGGLCTSQPGRGAPRSLPVALVIGALLTRRARRHARRADARDRRWATARRRSP
jgi:hypothetical protein